MSSDGVFSSAPTVFMPSGNPDQYFASSHYVGQHGRADVSNGVSPHGLPNSAPLSTNGSLVGTPGSLAGRKRSRGAIHDMDDEDDRNGGYDQAAAEAFAAGRPFELNQASRPPMMSRKSQRMNPEAPGPAFEAAQFAGSVQMANTAPEPAVDEAALTLGLSWSRMDSSEARQINQAAYTKWIQNHYPMLTNITVLFEYTNEAMPAYLVKAQNASSLYHGFYIFSHDLTEARFVTSDTNDLIPRMQMMPAVHLAAPGGAFRAESDPINASQNAVNNALAAAADWPEREESWREAEVWREPEGICSAHAMMMDDSD